MTGFGRVCDAFQAHFTKQRDAGRDTSFEGERQAGVVIGQLVSRIIGCDGAVDADLKLSAPDKCLFLSHKGSGTGQRQSATGES